jgi:hypothetical protein
MSLLEPPHCLSAGGPLRLCTRFFRILNTIIPQFSNVASQTYSQTDLRSLKTITMYTLITRQVCVARTSFYLGLLRITCFLANGDLGDVCVREIHTLRPNSSTGERSAVGRVQYEGWINSPTRPHHTGHDTHRPHTQPQVRERRRRTRRSQSAGGAQVRVEAMSFSTGNSWLMRSS